VTGRQLDQLHHRAAERTIADAVEDHTLHACGRIRRLGTERCAGASEKHDRDRSDRETDDRCGSPREPCHRFSALA